MSSYSTGQTWGALRKAWRAYKIAKSQNDAEKQRKYSERIKTLQSELGVPQTVFDI